jgi:GTP diphosphokinase / guanosine-3',5'-bis(diphosphate) 3'-diphosphatase
LGCASLEDLYTAVGGGAIRLDDLNRDLTEVGIVRGALRWTTVNLTAGAESNKPGVLSRLTGVVSAHSGNILRSVNNTIADGGFNLRLVISFPEDISKEAIEQTFRSSGIPMRVFEIV